MSSAFLLFLCHNPWSYNVLTEEKQVARLKRYGPAVGSSEARVSLRKGIL